MCKQINDSWPIVVTVLSGVGVDQLFEVRDLLLPIAGNECLQVDAARNVADDGHSLRPCFAHEIKIRAAIWGTHHFDERVAAQSGCGHRLPGDTRHLI